MARILVAGLKPEVISSLARRLAAASFGTLLPGNAFDEIGEEPPDLLVLDHTFAAPHTPELLASLRQGARTQSLAVVYCLGADADGGLACRLVRDLRVEHLVFHPLDEEELARRIGSLLGLTLAPEAALTLVPETSAPPGEERTTNHEPRTTLTAEPEHALQRKLAQVWNRTSSRMLERVELLERASTALLEGTLGAELREQATREAHKLAGSLGIFGLDRGTRFAREIEHALERDVLGNEAEGLRVSELVSALRLEIERAQAARAAAGPSSGAGWPGAGPAEGAGRLALLVSSDQDFAARLAEEAAAHGFPWEAASSVAAAREALAHSEASAVLVDFDAATNGEALEFLSELAAWQPPLPALVLTSQGSLMDRVEVVRRGGCGFLPKGLAPAEIVEATQALLDRRQRSQGRVLAVDDDPAFLAALQELLSSHGLRLAALSDPLRFWEAIEGFAPDLLLLDVDMPHVTGIELCRVVRNDPRWAGIPVLFLTGLIDAETVHRVFAAGADDFVTKPIVGPELVTRILNRLERIRLLRRAAETDPLTGLANRVKSRRMLQDFLRLADRQAQPLGLAALAVDGLGRLNEERGQAAGDEVLRWLAGRLTEEFRAEELTARWSGNDFVIGLYGLDRPESVRRLEGLRRALGAPTLGGVVGQEFRVTLSAGVAAYPDDANDLDGLRQAAVKARGRASAAGGDRVLAATCGLTDRQGRSLVDVAVSTADEALASLLAHAFESEGLRVRVLRNGLVAAGMLSGNGRSLRAKVLVIDVDLPGLDGFTLLRQLATAGVLQETSAILLTSPSVGGEAAAALELGVRDHVAKPFDVPVLVERVRQALASGRPQPAWGGAVGPSADRVIGSLSR